MIPLVLDESGGSERVFDIYSRLLRERIIFLGEQVTSETANRIVAQLLFLEAEQINEISQKSLKEFNNKKSNDILKLLIEKSDSTLYPSRILNLAIYILISNAQDLKEKDESGKNKMISDIFEKLNLSANKAEKDIGIYKSVITKMEQAKELIEELRIKSEKK